MSEIKHPTTCRICGQQFLNWQMDTPIIGQPVSERARQFVMTLAGHLNKKHGDKMKAIQIGGQEFMGMLIMMLFQTSDPNLLATTEQARVAVASVARRMVTDDEIAEMVEASPFDSSDDLTALLQRLRNQCCDIAEPPAA